MEILTHWHIAIPAPDGQDSLSEPLDFRPGSLGGRAFGVHCDGACQEPHIIIPPAGARAYGEVYPRNDSRSTEANKLAQKHLDAAISDAMQAASELEERLYDVGYEDEDPPLRKIDRIIRLISEIEHTTRE